MTPIALKGRITEAGQLEVTLPAGLPAGEVSILLTIPSIERTEQPEVTFEHTHPAAMAAVIQSIDDESASEGQAERPYEDVEWVLEQRQIHERMYPPG